MIIFHVFVHAKLLQSCPALCDPMDCSPPDSSVQEILEARILELIAFDPYKANLNTFLPSTLFEPQSYQKSRT